MMDQRPTNQIDDPLRPSQAEGERGSADTAAKQR
jgi:hypothetical protein